MAHIGKSLKVKGEISGSEDLYVDGEVEGTIQLNDNSLTVGPNGRVRANVSAQSITILGHLRGNVHAGERLEISKTGSLEGDLTTSRIVIEDGAVFRGSIDIVKPGGKKADGDGKPSSRAAASSPSAMSPGKGSGPMSGGASSSS